MSGRYMAYVGSYSYTGKAKGITVFDVDVEKGTFKERCEMEVNNSSYVIASSDGKTLYSIADEGVVSFRILQNGALARLNSAQRLIIYIRFFIRFYRLLSMMTSSEITRQIMC